MFSLGTHTPLMSGRNPHILAVLGDGTAGDFDTFSLQTFGDLLVGQWMHGILLLNHLFDPTLQNQKRRGATAGTLDGLGEKVSELEDALWGVRVFVRNGAADGGRMHADLLGYF